LIGQGLLSPTLLFWRNIKNQEVLDVKGCGKQGRSHDEGDEGQQVMGNVGSLGEESQVDVVLEPAIHLCGRMCYSSQCVQIALVSSQVVIWDGLLLKTNNRHD